MLEKGVPHVLIDVRQPVEMDICRLPVDLISILCASHNWSCSLGDSLVLWVCLCARHFRSSAQCFLTLYSTSQLLTALRKRSFKNIVRIGENAGYQHFLLFSQSFLLFLKQISILKSQ